MDVNLNSRCRTCVAVQIILEEDDVKLAISCASLETSLQVLTRAALISPDVVPIWNPLMKTIAREFCSSVNFSDNISSNCVRVLSDPVHGSNWLK